MKKLETTVNVYLSHRTESEHEAPLVPHSRLYMTDSPVERSLWLSQRRAFKTPQGDSGLPAFTLGLPIVTAQSIECHFPPARFSNMMAP